MRRRLHSPRYTIFVDASFNGDEDLTGIGMAIHCAAIAGRNGEIVDRIAEGHLNIVHSQGEAFGILRALELSRERGYRIIRVRCDYNSLRRSLKEDHQKGRVSRHSAYYADILEIARSFDEVKFGYVPRRKNQNAHRLSRLAAKHDAQNT